MNYVSRLQQWLIWRKKTVDWPCNYLNESDPRSNVHYLSSSENKTWKKFRPVRDLNPWPLRYRCSASPTELTSQLRASHYAVYSSLHGFIHGWFIVRCSLFTTAQVVHITARITFIHVFIRSSNIWLSHILSRSCNYSNLPWEVLVLRWQF